LQEEIIQSVLDGRDTLALLPTGGGKSVCFQVPALCRPGICLVISPLIALMKDQVRQLQERGISAVAIYSGMPWREIDRILDNCIYGEIRFLYLSPERLGSDIAQARIQRMPINLIAVDEAHCISQWGYDFRPPYLEIARIREWMPEVPVLALTATATREVVRDIQEKLLFKAPHVLQKSFARENLAYVVRETEGKEQQMLEILKKVPGTGVVYVRNRRKTRDVSDYLRQNGISADYYHAGLSPEERSRKQDAWMGNQTRIMVSTNAFGMGIDKPDVRTVVHLELPDSLEAYFQEAGRAGRDGKKAYAVLLYNDNDRIQLEKQYELTFPPIPEIRRAYQALGSYFSLATGSGQGQSYDFDLAEFAHIYQFDPIVAYNSLVELEREGWISLSEAVYHPATLQILVSKEQLYDYQLKHPELDNVLKLVLRSSQGVFSTPVHVQESRLSEYLRIPTEKLRNMLLRMHRDQVLEYSPQRDKPQLTLLRERVPVENLQIDRKRYEWRRQRHEERLRAAIAYAQADTCRSRLLLRYFDEEAAQDCGICDRCLERKKNGFSDEDYQRYRQKIRLALRHEALNVPDLLSAFAPQRREQVLKTLDYLLQEGYVLEKDQRLYWNE
jgi:ATP-dependent DNA helicase RecQ